MDTFRSSGAFDWSTHSEVFDGLASLRVVEVTQDFPPAITLTSEPVKGAFHTFIPDSIVALRTQTCICIMYFQVNMVQVRFWICSGVSHNLAAFW